MVIQPRSDTLRLFKQHDHALTCGEMARFWRGFERQESLEFEAMLAIAMHDCGWIDDDEQVRLDPKTSWPYDFVRMPIPQRSAVYRRAIEEAERVSDYAGLLVSVHFSGFAVSLDTEFAAAEAERQERLRAALGDRAEQSERDYFALKTLDLLSLAACLTPPGSDENHHPRWLTRQVDIGGVSVELRWEAENRLELSHSPLRQPVMIRLPYREIVRRKYASQDELADAWANAESGVAEVTIG
ncbi:MAG: hypothetical protein ACJAYU_000005 [Bradymonadia bacterium]|jgi:hypothetical protein